MPITVFYTPRMVADSQSYSPSARKPEQVVQSWLQLGLPLRLVEPEPVTRDQLCLAHSPVYVDGVLSSQKPNGFGAVAPCSGFHHAGHGFGGGFCTFNGLMVTACTLLKEARVQRIAARQAGVPVAWNLAGGYQRADDGSIRPVLDLHDNTLKAFARCFADVLI